MTLAGLAVVYHPSQVLAHRLQVVMAVWVVLALLLRLKLGLRHAHLVQHNAPVQVQVQVLRVDHRHLPAVVVVVRLALEVLLGYSCSQRWAQELLLVQMAVAAQRIWMEVG